MTIIFPKESLAVFPKHLTPDYRSTIKRSPSKPLIIVPHTLSELTGPVYGHDAVQEGEQALWKLVAAVDRLLIGFAQLVQR